MSIDKGVQLAKSWLWGFQFWMCVPSVGVNGGIWLFLSLLEIESVWSFNYIQSICLWQSCLIVQMDGVYLFDTFIISQS